MFYLTLPESHFSALDKLLREHFLLQHIPELKENKRHNFDCYHWQFNSFLWTIIDFLNVGDLISQRKSILSHCRIHLTHHVSQLWNDQMARIEPHVHESLNYSELWFTLLQGIIAVLGADTLKLDCSDSHFSSTTGRPWIICTTTCASISSSVKSKDVIGPCWWLHEQYG